MNLNEAFKHFVLQKHVGEMVAVPFSPKGDNVDDKYCLFVEACDADCITLAQPSVKKSRRQKASGKAPVTTVDQQRAHIPLQYIVVINDPRGVVLSFNRWWWENDF